MLFPWLFLSGFCIGFMVYYPKTDGTYSEKIGFRVQDVSFRFLCIQSR